MSTVRLPNQCHHQALIAALDDSGVLSPGHLDEVVVHFSRGCFITPPAIALLGAWALAARANGTQLSFRGDEDAIRYLSRMDVFDSLAVTFYDAAPPLASTSEVSGRFPSCCRCEIRRAFRTPSFWAFWAVPAPLSARLKLAVGCLGLLALLTQTHSPSRAESVVKKQNSSAPYPARVASPSVASATNANANVVV